MKAKGNSTRLFFKEVTSVIATCHPTSRFIRTSRKNGRQNCIYSISFYCIFHILNLGRNACLKITINWFVLHLFFRLKVRVNSLVSREIETYECTPSVKKFYPERTGRTHLCLIEEKVYDILNSSARTKCTLEINSCSILVLNIQGAYISPET